MIIVGSYHKTGTVLFENIWDTYFDNKKCYTFNNHFNEISDDEIKNTKCIVIIRHPYERIMSGVRYHQSTEEVWANKKQKNLNNLSYKQHINKLNMDDKIIFEMNNSGKYAIKSIYNDMKNRNFNNNVLFIKLEDLYIKENIPDICEKIKEHCNPSINIDVNKLTNCFLNALNKSFHRTNYNNTYTFNEYFKEHHINHFINTFPEDTLKILGYDDN